MIRSDNSVIASVIEFLEDNGGAAPAGVLCREVLGFDNCDESLALKLVKQGLPEDHRVIVDSSGEVLLARTRVKKNQILLKDCQFVIVDVEATSLPKPNNRVMEIGAIQMDYKERGQEYQTLLNPTVSIPKYVRQMTGITNEMVGDSPIFEEIADDFRSFVGQRIFVAHNVSFDIGIINSEFKRIGQGAIANPALCTVRMARKLIPGLDRYRLGEVSDYFGIEIENRHRAIDDAIAAAIILEKLLGIAFEKGMKSLEDLEKIGGLKSNKTW